MAKLQPLLLLFVLPALSLGRFRNITDEERLGSRLLRFYDVCVGPRFNASEQIRVHFRLSLVSINKMDGITQVLDTLAFLELVKSHIIFYEFFLNIFHIFSRNGMTRDFAGTRITTTACRCLW